MEPVRIVLIGLGRMGQVHARAIADLTELDVIGLCDPVPASRGAVAALYPDAFQFSDPGAALGTDGVEACLIAAPTPLHPELVELALLNDRHVLCEKPLSLDPGRADELGVAAARQGKVLQVGFWRRYSPPWATAKQLLDEGAIGDPVLIRLSQWDADPPPPEFCDPAVSGGLAVDCGVHEFDLAEWFTGARISEVRSEKLREVDPAIAAVGDVDNMLITAHLEDGTVAVVDLSRNARYEDDVRTEILGSEGAIFVDMLPGGSSRLATKDGVTIVPESEVADAVAAGVAAQAQAFARHVRGAKFDGPGARAGARSTRAGLAARASLESGAPQLLG